jgi:hypothetical protein
MSWEHIESTDAMAPLRPALYSASQSFEIRGDYKISMQQALEQLAVQAKAEFWTEEKNKDLYESHVLVDGPNATITYSVRAK